MKEEIFKYLDSQKIEQDIEEQAKYEQIKDYYSNAFKNGYFGSLNDLLHYKDDEIITMLLMANNPFAAIEIQAFLNKYPKLIKKSVIGCPLLGAIYFINYPTIKEIVKRGITESINMSIVSANKLAQECTRLGLNVKDIIPFTWFLKNYSDPFEKFNELFGGLTPKGFVVTINLILARERCNIKNKKSALILKEFLNKYEIHLNGLYNAVIKECERKEKERCRFNRRIEELKAMLDTEEEIKNIDTILNLCPNDEIKESVVDYILAHNKKIYLVLTGEYEKAKQNSDENLSQLFARYGFNYDLLNSEDEITLKEMSYEAIENLLSRLKALSISDINIGKIDIYKLDTIESLLAKGTINSSWVAANHDLLYKGNDELDFVLANLDELSDQGINIIQYPENQDVIRSNYLISNLSILKQYGLKTNRNTTSIAFLQAADLPKRIEFIISIGLYQDLTNSLDLLNYSLQECYKLKVAKALNLPLSILSDSGDELLCDFAASIIPEDIKEALNSEVNIAIPLPIFFQAFIINQQVLNINGVLVSVEKLKRNIGKIGTDDLESCFYGIIYEGYYTLEEIEILRQALMPNRGINNSVRK